MLSMKILSWNIRDAGRKGSNPQVSKIVITHNRDIIFLMETKVNSI